jgi:hypothetical protein
MLKALTSTYDTYIRLNNIEIPKLETELTSTISKLAEVNKDVDLVHLITFINELANDNRFNNQN